VIVIGLAAPVSVIPETAGDIATVYPVTGLPPSEEGAANVTVACPSPATTATLCGAEGALSGEPDAMAAGLVPETLSAVTENVYTVPGDSPVTMIGLDKPVKTSPPEPAGEILTVYPVTGLPPFEAGGEK